MSDDRLMVTVDAEDLALLFVYARETMARDGLHMTMPTRGAGEKFVAGSARRARARAAMSRLSETAEVIEALKAIENMGGDT